MNWLDRAVCRGEDPEIFFPQSRQGDSPVRTALAKAICGRCPVSDACLQWALRTDQRIGVWGGLTESERRRIKFLRHRARRRSESDG